MMVAISHMRDIKSLLIEFCHLFLVIFMVKNHHLLLLLHSYLILITAVKKEITLTFDQKIKIEFEYEHNGLKHLMKDQFFFSFDNRKPSINEVVKELEFKDDQIIIRLNTNQKFSNITWLPNKDYSNTKEVYNGPMDYWFK